MDILFIFLVCHEKCQKTHKLTKMQNILIGLNMKKNIFHNQAGTIWTTICYQTSQKLSKETTGLSS